MTYEPMAPAKGPQKPLVLLGLDIETCASEFQSDNKLIQIGVSLLDARDPQGARLTFLSDVGWPDGSFVMNLEASAVHGISRDRVLSADRAELVDACLFQWLLDNGVNAKRGIMIGHGVSYFDAPFIRRDLPRTATLMSYRSVELNAVIFTIAHALNMDAAKLKSAAKEFALQDLSKTHPSLHAHNALYDAIEACLVFDYLTALIRGTHSAST